MVSDSAPPAAATTSVADRSGSTVQPDATTSARWNETPPTRVANETVASVVGQAELLTVLVAVVGAGLLLDGIVATFAALFCLGVAAFVLGRITVAEWRRLELGEEHRGR